MIPLASLSALTIVVSVPGDNSVAKQYVLRDDCAAYAK